MHRVHGAPVATLTMRELGALNELLLGSGLGIGEMNLILCRNVMIYFEPELQKHSLAAEMLAVSPILVQARFPGVGVGQRPVVGDLGAGKSVLQKLIAEAVWARGGCAICIDRTPVREWATFARIAAKGRAAIRVTSGAIRRSAFGVRRSAFGVRRSAFGVRRPASGVRRWLMIGRLGVARNGGQRDFAGVGLPGSSACRAGQRAGVARGRARFRAIRPADRHASGVGDGSALTTRVPPLRVGRPDASPPSLTPGAEG